MRPALNNYPSVELKVDNLKSKIDFLNIFGRCGPVHIEIGSGKGTFLLNQGKAKPDVNFLGIEWARKYYRHAIDRIGRWGLENVRITRTDATDFVTNLVPDNSVDCFHIYFPDPWPKRKQHKRRFFSSSNLVQVLRCLTDDGIIKFVTDHEHYFQQVRKIVTELRDKLAEIEFEPAAGAGAGEVIGTNYERKYIKENRNVYAIALKKQTSC